MITHMGGLANSSAPNAAGGRGHLQRVGAIRQAPRVGQQRPAKRADDRPLAASCEATETSFIQLN